MTEIFDVAIIGGGINGCGCAADAALRGLSVVLLEKDDLASKTSSNSTKLIHGGLRYLEHFEFALVKKALKERQLLLGLAPHLIVPQIFILPYQKHMRSSWLLRTGLFIYDHLSPKNLLQKCQTINRTMDKLYFEPLVSNLIKGFSFYDAATDDARLTITNAIQAKKHGASIHSHSGLVETEIIEGIWHLSVQPAKGEPYKLKAKTLINAAGPWVQSVAQITHVPMKNKITLVKGSHIVVPKMYEGNHAYFLQHDDKRVIFIIPYQGFNMIGTTDVEYRGALDRVSISEDEIEYLIHFVNSCFQSKINKTDIVHTWSGVRPLIASEGKENRTLSRDYSYEFIQHPAPIITIYGGKITTYRQLAEEVINQLKLIFPSLPDSKTQITPLPGATFKTMDFQQYALYAKEKYYWLDAAVLKRYLYSYGSLMEEFLSSCTQMQSLGRYFGASLYQIEVDYLIAKEWARDSSDILERRTKLGLTMKDEEIKQLNEYLAC